MNNLIIAFDIVDEGDDVPSNLKSLGVHLVFDIKMDLACKAILVVDVNRTEEPFRNAYEWLSR